MGTRGSPLRLVGVPGMVATVVRGARELSTTIADVAGKLDLRVALNSLRNRHPWRCQLSRQMHDAGGAAGAGGGRISWWCSSWRARRCRIARRWYKVGSAVVVLVVVVLVVVAVFSRKIKDSDSLGAKPTVGCGANLLGSEFYLPQVFSTKSTWK